MATENGTKVLKFGAPLTEYGICEDVSISEEADKLEIEDGGGDVVGTIHFKPRTKVSATYTPLTGNSSNPKPGDAVTLGGKAVILDSFEEKGKKGAVTTWALTGYLYPSLATGTP